MGESAVDFVVMIVAHNDRESEIWHAESSAMHKGRLYKSDEVTCFAKID